MTSLQLPKGREQRLSFFLFNSLNKFILKMSIQAINSIRNNVHSPESPCLISEDESRNTFSKKKYICSAIL